MLFQKTIIGYNEKYICQAFIFIMERIFKRIKNRFQQLKKPTEKTQEILKLSLWIFSVYTCINLLPFINKLLINLPSGLFLVLLLNAFLLCPVIMELYPDALAVKNTFNKKDYYIISIIYATHIINRVLFACFIIFNIILYVWQ